jgi:hypothetical protein
MDPSCFTLNANDFPGRSLFLCKSGEDVWFVVAPEEP